MVDTNVLRTVLHDLGFNVTVQTTTDGRGARVGGLTNLSANDRKGLMTILSEMKYKAAFIPGNIMIVTEMK